MTPLLKKLNFKGQTQLCILHSPPEFAAEMKKMDKAKPRRENNEHLRLTGQGGPFGPMELFL
jgi:hypothetical protein